MNKIYLLGDSTCQTNNEDTYPQTGWGQLLNLFVNENYEVVNLAKNGMSEDELLRAKNFKKSCIAYSSETNSDIAEINATCLHLYTKTLSTEERVKNFDSVTLEQVCDFATQIANEETFNVVAIGKKLKMEDITQF